MFDLEKSIAEWRRQMLTAGIKNPAPIEELESHLREEIAQTTKSGLNELKAFNSAVQKIGRAGLLKTEFTKTGGFIEWPEDKLKCTNRVLGLLWLVFCSYVLVRCFALPNPGSFLEAKALLGLLIYLSGAVGGVLLVLDSKWGSSITRTIALFQAVLCFFQIFTAGCSILLGFFAAFYVVSILLLHLPQQTHHKTAGL